MRKNDSQSRGGSSAFGAFRIWGPGKTAKVQCDACAMFSPEMFRDFVKPALAEQCAWLDHAIYHLDGTQCICHLDHLLAIDSLRAIEWTPQAGIEGGAHERWFPLYKRILDAGKSVQIMGGGPCHRSARWQVLERPAVHRPGRHRHVQWQRAGRAGSLAGSRTTWEPRGQRTATMNTPMRIRFLLPRRPSFPSLQEFRRRSLEATGNNFYDDASFGVPVQLMAGQTRERP